ncbi:MAG: class II aldolase/adducin family protein, partial [Thermus sp.]
RHSTIQGHTLMTEVSGDDVHSAARRLEACGLNRGAAGNVSARRGTAFLITPSGLEPDACTPDDMVLVDQDGGFAGRLKPSSEWRIHRDIYRARPEAGAVVHTHAPFATALACIGADIPPFHYMIARFGGATVRCPDCGTLWLYPKADGTLFRIEGDTCRCGRKVEIPSEKRARA